MPRPRQRGPDGEIGEPVLQRAEFAAGIAGGCTSGLAISGGNLFVANNTLNTVGEYTTAGATVNASLISGLGYPGAPGLDGVAVSGWKILPSGSLPRMKSA